MKCSKFIEIAMPSESLAAAAAAVYIFKTNANVYAVIFGVKKLDEITTDLSLLIENSLMKNA